MNARQLCIKIPNEIHKKTQQIEEALHNLQLHLAFSLGPFYGCGRKKWEHNYV